MTIYAHPTQTRVHLEDGLQIFFGPVRKLASDLHVCHPSRAPADRNAPHAQVHTCRLERLLFEAPFMVGKVQLDHHGCVPGGAAIAEVLDPPAVLVLPERRHPSVDGGSNVFTATTKLSARLTFGATTGRGQLGYLRTVAYLPPSRSSAAASNGFCPLFFRHSPHSVQGMQHGAQSTQAQHHAGLAHIDRPGVLLRTLSVPCTPGATPAATSTAESMEGGGDGEPGVVTGSNASLQEGPG